jgi:hypothetical protein
MRCKFYFLFILYRHFLALSVCINYKDDYLNFWHLWTASGGQPSLGQAIGELDHGNARVAWAGIGLCLRSRNILNLSFHKSLPAAYHFKPTSRNFEVPSQLLTWKQSNVGFKWSLKTILYITYIKRIVWIHFTPKNHKYFNLITISEGGYSILRGLYSCTLIRERFVCCVVSWLIDWLYNNLRNDEHTNAPQPFIWIYGRKIA